MADQENAPQRNLVLQKIYVKDLSFESPNAPAVFHANWQPQVELNLGIHTQHYEGDRYECTLTVSVQAKHEDQTAFLAEVQQSALVEAQGFTEAERGPLFGSYCPNLLFPFAREAINDLVGRGGFPQLLLQPVNFDELYQQRLREQQSAADDSIKH